MIIAISSSGQKTTSKLDSRFGRCEYFAFYDTDEESWIFLANPGALQESGAGVKAGQFVIDNKAGAVVTGEAGPKAAQVLKAAGIEVFCTSEVALQEALEQYKGKCGPEPEKTSGHEPAAARISHGKIAIATEAGEVAPHFGRCAEYTLVEIQDGEAAGKKVVPNPGHQPGFLPRFLGEMGVSCVIAGGMGPRAQNLFTEQGIQTIVGVTGPVDDILQGYLTGRLSGGESLCSHPQGHGSCDGD